MFLFLYALFVRSELVLVNKYHHTARLLLTVAGISPFKFIFNCGYWVNYAMKGRGNIQVWGMGLVVDAFMTTGMICLFVLLGSG